MIYRDAEEALRVRREELLAERWQEVRALPHKIVAVYPRRQARRAAGLVGLSGAVVLAGVAILQGEGLTTILLRVWLCMLVAYVLTWLWSFMHARTALARAFMPSDWPGDDVARIERLRPVDVVAELAAPLERRSVLWPLLALATLMPLTLHYLVVAMLQAGAPAPHDFDSWMRGSLMLVGHCHVILAWRAWRFTRCLPNDDCALRSQASRAGWQAWGVTIAWSAAPGLIFLAIFPIAGIALIIVAPVLVGATGVTFIPAMFHVMGRKIGDERAVLTSS